MVFSIVPVSVSATDSTNHLHELTNSDGLHTSDSQFSNEEDQSTGFQLFNSSSLDITSGSALAVSMMNATSTSLVTRDTVLILDNSVSMAGTPLAYTKTAAIKFCGDVLQADGINRVAIIIYDTTVTATQGFTEDLATLTNTINTMNGVGSWTNMNVAMINADSFMSSSTADIKNVLLMTDGVPTAGDWKTTGRYSVSDYAATHNASRYVFEYANVLYETAVSMHSKYSIYTLGFYHNASLAERTFGAKLLRDVQNAGYYEVINPDDLDFEFGRIADDIVNPVGTFKYAGYIEQNQDSSARYNYDDAYFMNDSRTYNPQLATMSLCFELSSWSSYDTSEWQHKTKNARELLTGEVLQSNGTYDKKTTG